MEFQICNCQITANVFISKFFISVFQNLGVKNITTIAYHPQTNEQEERYNRTLVSRLRLYVASNQRNWDILGQQLTYRYNHQPDTNFFFAYTTATGFYSYRQPHGTTYWGVFSDDTRGPLHAPFGPTDQYVTKGVWQATQQPTKVQVLFRSKSLDIS